VVSFGWRYDFNGGGFQQTEPMPGFLLPLRDNPTTFAGLAPDVLEHALITEYREGAAIGWHKDRSVFGDVIGISLLSSCLFRFRLRGDAGWERHSLNTEPRSAYLLRGPSRTTWEHSIPAVPALRYSVTFRTLEAEKG
jgi:alkylated DNA repair dioxygenase AlkB